MWVSGLGPVDAFSAPSEPPKPSLTPHSQIAITLRTPFVCEVTLSDTTCTGILFRACLGMLLCALSDRTRTSLFFSDVGLVCCLVADGAETARYPITKRNVVEFTSVFLPFAPRKTDQPVSWSDIRKVIPKPEPRTLNPQHIPRALNPEP